MKKICIVFPYPMGKDFMSGGVTKLVIQNARVASQKYETHLIMPQNNNEFKAYINNTIPKVIVHIVDFDFISSFGDTANRFSRAKQIIQKAARAITKKKNLINEIVKINPDLVHLHAEVCCMFMPQLSKLNYKILLHTSVYKLSSNPVILKYVQTKIRKYADYLVSPTKTIDQLYTNANKYVLENPIVSTKQIQPLPDSEPITTDQRLKLIYTGRICRVKQIHYLLEAMSKIQKDKKDKVFAYLIGKPNNSGDEAYQEELKDLVKKLNIKNVSFLGYKSNVQDYLQYSDVGVLLTKSEAISMSCVEYMSGGLAVLGFNNPGINEAVIDGFNGALVEDGDVNGLTKTIESFIDSPSDLQTLKKNARTYSIEHFSIETFQIKLLKIYEDILHD